jgi:hypothetical protein
MASAFQAGQAPCRAAPPAVERTTWTINRIATHCVLVICSIKIIATSSHRDYISQHACSDFTRLTPKVKDIVFVATFKVMFRPLVDKIPGFGALINS